jgi:hypothetical protein
MNLIYRRILYTTFILAFLVLAPLLLMYANGYRYDFKEGQITKTGVLILESKPQKVNIYINEKLKYTKTPINGESLTPGLYNIKVAKNGYHPWEKELKIESNLTTFAQDVILFKKTEAVKIIDGDFDDFTLSSDDEKIITLWQDETTAEIWEYELKKQQSRLLLRNSLNGSKMKIEKWSKNSKNLILKNYSELTGKNNYFIIAFQNAFWQNSPKAIIISLNELILEPVMDVRWDDSDDNIIYANTSSSLYRINLANKTSKKISGDEINGFIVYNKILHFNRELSCLVEIDKNPTETKKSTKADCFYYLTQDNDYELISSPRGLITLVSPSSKNLLVIDLNSKNKIFQAKAEEVKWDTFSNKMLYYDDIEINIFSPDHEHPYKNEIIGRYGQEVKNALWYCSHHHLIVLFNNDIKIMELDARDKRNIIDFNSFSNLKNIYLDEKGENIYVTGSKNGDGGIWQINIF